MADSTTASALATKLSGVIVASCLLVLASCGGGSGAGATCYRAASSMPPLCDYYGPENDTLDDLERLCTETSQGEWSDGDICPTQAGVMGKCEVTMGTTRLSRYYFTGTYGGSRAEQVSRCKTSCRDLHGVFAEM